jgi:sodium-dependent dicarboxylate transporter 2/3/5
MDELGPHATPPAPRARSARPALAIAAGPLLAAGVYAALSTWTDLSQGAAATAAVAALMAAWWLTEAIPLAATALLPLCLFPLLGVATTREIGRAYGDDVIWVFLGGFLIQLAMEKWGLHRRLALVVMLAAGGRRGDAPPARLILGLMCAAALCSMWISNAATAAMMLPIVVTVCRFVTGDADPAEKPSNFAKAAMIGVGWAATIGGLATPIGTAPNLIVRQALETQHGVTIGFLQWMAFGLPISAVLLVASWLLLTRWFFPVATPASPAPASDAPAAFLRKELARLGPVSRGEWNTLAVFAFAVFGWMFGQPIAAALGLIRRGTEGAPDTPFVTDGVVAIAAGLLLFLLPVDLGRARFTLDWAGCKSLPFGVLLLFGGGMALADTMGQTGLSKALGGTLSGLTGVSPILLVLIVTAACVFMSEFVSNTALTQTMSTVMGPAAAALGVPPATLLVPTALGASCAFMMPVGTPPSAIVFSSGYFRIADMAKAGFALNLIGVATITAAMALLAL